MSRYVVGVLAGWAVWVTLYVTYIACAVIQHDLPHAMRPTVRVVEAVAGFASMPVALAGFAWGWGVGPPPLPFLGHPAFHVLLGLSVYGALGAVAASAFGRKPD